MTEKEFPPLWKRMEEDGSLFAGETIKPQCQSCVFYERATHTCPAFPNGIPSSIQVNTYDHRRVYPLQKGFLVWIPVIPGTHHPLEGVDDRER